MYVKKVGRVMFLCLAFLLLMVTFFPLAFADTLFLKNGRSIDGFILRQDSGSLDLDVGIGVVKFEDSEIERIAKSTPEESAALKKSWEISRIKFEKARLERERAPKEINLVESHGTVIVQALLNQKASVGLFLDTGASLTLISESVAMIAGIDLAKEKNIVRLKVADGRTVDAKIVVLKSVRVESVTAENVEAAVIADQMALSGVGNGVLGMSFLRRFNFKVDYTHKQLILEKR